MRETILFEISSDVNVTGGVRWHSLCLASIGRRYVAVLTMSTPIVTATAQSYSVTECSVERVAVDMVGLSGLYTVAVDADRVAL